MKKWIWSGIIVLSAMLILGGIPAQAQQKLFKFNTAWEPEHETFIMWYAKEKGWDKEVGLDFNILYFDSGMGMLEALPAKQWGVGALGGTPAVVGAARYGTKIIAIGTIIKTG